MQAQTPTKKSANLLLYFGLFLISVALGVALVRGCSGSGVLGDTPEVDWRELADLDFVTGEAPQKLKDLDGKPVRVPGFMVPLEDDQRKVVEWLLVPTPQACIHVPPPPPNQMVHIFMKRGTEVMYGPIWVYGTLRLRSTRSIYGESSFSMEATKVTEYK